MTGERGASARRQRIGRPGRAGPPGRAGAGDVDEVVLAAGPVRSAGRRYAVGIYGTIVTAGVLASAGDEISSLDLTISILITLLVYWVAEEYAEILGDYLAGGRLPTWRYAVAALAATWPMVGASLLPLLLVVGCWLLGAAPSAAANVGLIAAVAELMFYAWAAGRAADLPRRHQFTLTVAAAALGLLMVFLKDVVLVRLH
jgi:hypothetical protein